MREMAKTIIALIAIGGALYIGIYWGIVSPILTVADAYDNGTLTGVLIATQFLWFFLKEAIAGVWFTMWWVLAVSL